jgi:glutamate synthase domain-containing protein 1
MNQSQASPSQHSSSRSSLAADWQAEPACSGLHSHPAYPLYDPRFEHDACGTGFIANIAGIREHRVLAYALEALANLAHRGAMDADAETSDGAGIMTQLPHRLLNAWLAEQGLAPVAGQNLAVGMFFLPVEAEAAAQARDLATQALERRGAAVLGWRVVPIDPAALGAAARRSCPRIEQALIRRPDTTTPEEFERLLYLARKESESRLAAAGLTGAYIASLSARTLV